MEDALTMRRIYGWLMTDVRIARAGLIGIEAVYLLSGVALCRLWYWLR